MKTPIRQFVVAVLGIAISVNVLRADESVSDNSLPSRSETKLIDDTQKFELAKTNYDDEQPEALWALRSEHLVFGMPRLIDDRHNFTPSGFSKEQPGISLVVREGFVVGHFDRMKAPLWVAQRWTTYDEARLDQTNSQERPWQEDMEIPPYARGGTSYEGNQTQLDRGHMARHEMNRAWGIDSSNFGVKMSNSAPQHMNVNRNDSAWQALENEVRDMVKGTDADVKVLWTISGTIYRDKANPSGETPEADFSTVVRLNKGKFGVPDATYKVVAWFDEDGEFHARAFVFEQKHNTVTVNGRQVIKYQLENPKKPIAEYIVPIRELEQRIGLNFFPMLRDDIEDAIEMKNYESAWGID